MAIINDKIYREGDEIEKYRIVRIGEDEVIAVRGKRRRTFKIPDLVKKKER